MSGQTSLSLRIHDPHGAQRDVEIHDFPAIVGRQEGCDVWVDDPKVSRKHVRFEVRDGQIVCVDLGSSNGFRWNGKNVREAQLKADGRLRVGQTRIEVVAARVPKEPPKAPSRKQRSGAEPVVLEGVQNRRRRIVMSGAVIVLALVAGVSYYVTTKVVSESQESDPRIADAEERAAELKKRLAGADKITLELLKLVDGAAREFADVRYGDETNPVLDLQYRVRNRYALEQRSFLGAVILRKQELLSERRFGEALAYFNGVVEGFTGERAQELTLINLQRETAGVTKAAFEDLMADLDYLESGIADAVEIDERYDESIVDFKDTPYEQKLMERHARRPVRAVVTAPSVTDTSSERSTAEVVANPAEQLASLIRGVLETPDAFGRRTYPFTVFSGTPIGIDDASVLTIRTDEDERTLPMARAPKATRLLMAHDTLQGSQLLEAVSVAYAWGHDVVAGKMLHRYIEEVKGRDAREQRRGDVMTMIAQARGDRSIPEGGYDFHAEFGWESAVDRTQRVVLVEAQKLTAKFTVRAKESQLRSSVEKIETHLKNEDLTPQIRRKIRTLAVDSLAGLRETLTSDVGDNVAKLLAPLRAEKEELNRRRAAAKKVIYDPEIYLPEDHPDWPKGDNVNGQLQVNEKVLAVREIWNAADKKKISVPKAAVRAVSLIRVLDNDLLSRFGVRPPKEVDPRLAELLRNPYPELSVRNYSLNDAEAAIYRFSRKVEEYNRAFSHEDLSEQDQGHFYVMNDYRELFGHQRCFIDIRLCRATKKHSAECNKAGRIWHDGPNGTPQSRAKAEGFESGVAENVAIGYANPKGIWDQGWYRASDHHRNALAESHNCLGYGYVGSVGTQNFATIDPPFEVQ